MIHARVLLALLLIPSAAPLIAAETFIVENGQPRAEIVIAEKPERMVRLAAHDLQTYVKKISGAHLPIVTQPSTRAVQIFVGRSEHTDRLHITAEGLKHGAYRIVSGDRWLVLLGDDTDFQPIEPWAKGNADIVSGKIQREWEQITGAQWGVPNATMYKHRITLPGEIGRPDAATGKIEPWQAWGLDERGSFNAVAGFLHGLGVRWYMPGELGEVVPTLTSITLPKIDETVRPDFPIRRFNFRFGTNGLEISQWAMRLGTRDPINIQVAHGLHLMTHRPEIFRDHPEWFALYGGKRQTQPDQRLNQLCYSNEELFQETVRYARAQFDHFGFDAVSIMPPDGYTAICQCKLCEGKDAPERENLGLLSDYVWDFVNRVAKEVGKTHPDKKILNCAYGTYALPPLKIAKLEPNVLVCVVGGRRPIDNKPEQQERLRQRREAWAAKTDNPILVFENFPFTDRGWYLPAFVPHTLGESVNATKGMSQGEDIWLTIRPDFAKLGVGLNHFLVYFTARSYWGGPQLDVDAMFREYCWLFYGPAETEMHAFFTYCEANWQEMEKDKTKVDAALAHFASAQAKVDASSVYGRRIALIDDFLKDLRSKSLQLGRLRGPVPQFRLGRDAAGIVIDGKLDDEFWQKYPSVFVGKLRELQTGGLPTFGTTFKAAWGKDGNLYLAIRCDEHPGEKLNIGATKNDDAAIFYGDVVEILLETESRSHYQIAVSPSGAVTDLDRSASRAAWFSWDSQADVATQIADDHWTLEIRIPVTQDENDPLHQVIGRKPLVSLPWHFNVCRQRIRENGQEISAFAPTGKANFHEVMKFARLYEGRSHQFDAAEPDADYLESTRVAADLARQGRRAEAMSAYTAAAEGKITDYQKAVALEQAAALARSLRRHDVAAQLADRIPIEAVKKTVLMRSLLDQAQASQVVTQFGAEDIGAWPFWKSGDGYFSRGLAYAITKSGKEAEADLARALEWTGDPRIRDAILQTQAGNRERNLQDESGALSAYHAIIDSAERLGSSEQFTAVGGIARILTKRGKYDEAIAVLRKVEIDKLRGTWHGTLLLVLGDTHRADGRLDEARAAYQAVIDDEDTEAGQRKAAEQSIQSLQSQK